MRRASLIILFLALALVFLPGQTSAVALAKTPASQPQPLRASSGQLVEQNRRFDGRPLVYQGEVVGDVMVRGRFAWINVNDDAYSKAKPGQRFKLRGYNSGQSVWLPAGEARKVKTVGDYNHRGDVVRVIGVFNRACREHGGDMDIHAGNLRIIKRGYAIKHPIDRREVGMAVVLLAGAALVAGGRYRSGFRR